MISGLGLLFFIFLLLLPLLAVFLFFHLITISFVKLGIPSWAVLLIFILCLVGSLINIPVWYSFPATPPAFYYHPPSLTAGRIIAINLGGCLIPSLLGLYVLRRANLLKAGVAIAIITAISYLLATPVPGKGITLPFFIPPLASAAVAFLLTKGKNSAPVAYASGVFGTLIGADLLHLADLPAAGVMSIGGGGVFDGIFLTGIIAAFLT